MLQSPRTLVALAAAAMALSACSASTSSTSATDDGGKLRIALFTQVDAQVVTDAFDGFKAAFLESSGRSPGSVEWINKSAQGDNEKCSVIARELASSDLDGIAVVGTPCVVAMAAQDKTTPIFALGMGDPVAAKVAESLDAPGTNVTGSSRAANDGAPIAEQVLRTTPAPGKVAVIYDQSNESMVRWVNGFVGAAQAQHVEVVKSGVSTIDQVGPAARSVVPRVEAVVVGPDGLVGPALPAIVSSARQSHIPVYTSGLGNSVKTPGVVADIGQSYTQIGRLGAQTAVKVLIDGASPASTAFVEVTGYVWTVNTRSAADLGITIPADVMKDAVTVQ